MLTSTAVDSRKPPTKKKTSVDTVPPDDYNDGVKDFFNSCCSCGIVMLGILSLLFLIIVFILNYGPFF